MTDNIKELDMVALLEPLPKEGLSRGTMGTVVMDFGDGVYLIEFADSLGKTYALPEVKASQLLLLHKIQHAQAV